MNIATHQTPADRPDSESAILHRPFKWLAAMKAGLICGGLFLLLPLGSPWSAMSINSGAVMGRTIAQDGSATTTGNILLHLGLSVVYALIISYAVKNLRSWRGILFGAVMGAILYGVNLAVTVIAFPQLQGMESRVVFTHLVFGIFTAALYKGMARTRDVAPEGG